MAFSSAGTGNAAKPEQMPQPADNQPANTAETKQTGASVSQAVNNQQAPAFDSGTAGATLKQGTPSEQSWQGQQQASDNGSGAWAAQLGAMGISSSGQQMPSDNDADDLTVSARPANLEASKTPAGMANNIAQLDQAVSSQKTVEAPAMTQHLSHPDWNQELGQKLIWMHKQDLPSAELRINPPHLGPLSIKVDVDQDQATISFTTQHQDVKDAIEAAIPKLREMLGGQQLNLADVNISQQQSGEKQARDAFQTAAEQGQGNKSGQNNQTDKQTNQAGVDIVEEIDSGRVLVSNGLLSLFA